MYGEDVEAWSLHDVVVCVGQDHGLAAALVRFEEPHLQVEPVVVLDGRVDGRWCYALPVGDDGVSPRSCFSGSAIQMKGTTKA